MTRLIWIEFRRLFARQSVRALLVLIVLGSAGIALLARNYHDDPTPRTDALLRAHRAEAEERIRLCMQPPGGGVEPSKQLTEELRQALIKQQEEFVPSRRRCVAQVDDLLLSLHETRPLYLSAFLAQIYRWAPLAGLGWGFLIGASFVGADWSSGWMKTFLTWECRRFRVWASKATVAALAPAAISLYALGFSAISLGILGRFEGSFLGFDNILQADVSESLWRTLFMSLFGGILGFAPTALLRFTLSSPLVVMGYWGLESTANALLGQEVRAWSPARSVLVSSFGFDSLYYNPLSAGRALLLLTISLIVLCVVSSVGFFRRDVTS